MKKLLAIKERPADGGQDAHEKGDRSIMLGFACSLTFTSVTLYNKNSWVIHGILKLLGQILATPYHAVRRYDHNCMACRWS